MWIGRLKHFISAHDGRDVTFSITTLRARQIGLDISVHSDEASLDIATRNAQRSPALSPRFHACLN
jgi:hypothetical protein